MIEIQNIEYPNTFRRLTECIQFIVKLTDLGSEGTTIGLGYQLLDNNGNELSEKYRYDPKDTNNFSITINHIIKEYLFVKVPDTISSDPVSQSGYIGKFKLKLWEYVTTNGCETTEENEIESDLVTVLNSSLQWNDYYVGLNDIKLKHLSPNLELGVGAIDYMTVFDTKTLKIEYIKNGNVGHSITKTTVANEVSILKINVLDYEKIKIYQGTTLKYNIIPTCADLHFIFFDPYGSWSALSINKINEGIKNEQTEVCSSGGCITISDKKTYQQHGLSTVDKKNYEIISGQYEFLHSDIEYIKRFFASNNHFILLKKSDPDNYEWVKFILESGEYILFDDNSIKVSVKGSLAKGFKINETTVIANG